MSTELPKGAEHIHDAWREWGETGAKGLRWRFVVPLEQFRSLEVCRDHWKTSFDHERANVIRLRGLLMEIHGTACICVDCQTTREKAPEE